MVRRGERGGEIELARGEITAEKHGSVGPNCYRK